MQEAKVLQCYVHGRPAPQGSKVRTKYGMREASKYLKPWRDAVVLAATQARNSEATFDPFTGPVRIDITFFIERPANTKWGRYPAGVPDLSKLLRSTEDALTQAGVWTDDALVVKANVQKLWTGPDSHPSPGCSIFIQEI